MAIESKRASELQLRNELYYYYILKIDPEMQVIGYWRVFDKSTSSVEPAL